jgi:hypothetical protein
VLRAKNGERDGVSGDGRRLRRGRRRNSETECATPVTAVGLYLASTGTVWQSFACDDHAHQLIAPRALQARDRDQLRRREHLAQDPRIGRRYAGEQDGPLARGAAAAALVSKAIMWARLHPFHIPPAPTPPPARDDRQRREGGRMTVDELADELGLHPGDIRVLLSWLDPDTGGLHPDGTLLNEYGGAVRDQFVHLCERSVPDYWWPGHNPGAGTGATRMR